MKHRVAFFLTICLVAAASLIFAQTAQQPANYGTTGAGTDTNPYQIATWQNLYWLSQNSEHWDAHFIQTANIDFGTASPPIQEWDGGKGWTPIGFFCRISETNNNPFTGKYDGDGHAITGLFANRAEMGDGDLQPPPGEGHPEDPEICPLTSVGLFGSVDGAVIRDLNLIAVDMSGLSGVGALAVETIFSTVENVSASGTVSGAEAVGGLIGVAVNSNITDVSSSVNVSTVSFSGGLLGAAFESTIRNSFATGSITADGEFSPGELGLPGPQGGMLAASGMADRRYSRSSGSSTSGYRFSGFAIGGFIGDAVSSTIEQSYSTGDVQGGVETGGFASYISGNTVIRESFSTSSVSGARHVGGFIGYAFSGEIHDSYHRGDVAGEENVGGFTGTGGSVTITHSYSTGAVTGSSEVNGFVGFYEERREDELLIEDSFWDITTSGIGEPGDDNFGATGKTTEQMQNPDLFTDIWDIRTDDNIPVGYPMLTWELNTNSPPWTFGTGGPPAIPLSGWSTGITLLLMGIFTVRIVLRKLL